MEEKTAAKKTGVNIATMSDTEITQLEEGIKARKQRHKWKGNAGIWTAFRKIGTAYAHEKQSEFPDAEKVQKLRYDIDKFVAERIETTIAYNKTQRKQ